MGFMTPPSVRQPVFWIPFAQSKLQKNFPCKMAFKNKATYAGPQILNPLFTCQLQPEIKLKKNKPRNTKQEIDLTRQSPIYKKGCVGGC